MGGGRPATGCQFITRIICRERGRVSRSAEGEAESCVQPAVEPKWPISCSAKSEGQVMVDMTERFGLARSSINQAPCEEVRRLCCPEAENCVALS